MFITHPSEDREHMIAGYALPNGRIIRSYVPIRPIVDHELASVGDSDPAIYDELHDGVLSELGLALPPQIGFLNRFRGRIKKIAKKVTKVAKKVAKNRLVKAAWKIVNNPMITAAMGPFAAVPLGLSNAAKVVRSVKALARGKNPIKVIGSLALSAAKSGLGSDVQASLRLAAKAVKGSSGNLDKAEHALRRTALKAVARKSPKARTAINSAMQKVEKTTTASARKLAATPKTRVFNVRGPSGTVYQFTRAA